MSAAIEQRNQDATCYVGNLDERVHEELLWELMLQAVRFFILLRNCFVTNLFITNYTRVLWLTFICRRIRLLVNTWVMDLWSIEVRKMLIML